MESKYKEGDFVYAIAHPAVKLVIRRYIPTIYYCRLVDDPDAELVYFERELQPAEPVLRSMGPTLTGTQSLS